MMNILPNASCESKACDACAATHAHSSARRGDLTVRNRLDGREITVRGQFARTLRMLIDADDRGVLAEEVTPRTHRVSRYVFWLRQCGLDISMDFGRPGDGAYGRYTLHTPLTRVQARTS
jgi:hypothetical protein